MLQLKKFMFYNALTQTKIAEIIKEPQSVVSLLVNEKRLLLPRHMESLISHFGKELIDKYSIPDEEYFAQKQNAVATVLPAEVVEDIKAEVKEELIAEVSVPMVSEDVSAASNIDLEAYVEDNGDEMDQFNVGGLLKHVKVGERITSSSMSPTLNNGDLVFLRFIDKESIISGKTYYFELVGLPRMARLVKFEGDMLRLIAANPKYDDIVIERKKVKKVARIVCSMRFNFDNIYSDLDEIRKQKDELIISMINAQTEQSKGFIEQFDKFNEREDRLVDMLVKNLTR